MTPERFVELRQNFGTSARREYALLLTWQGLERESESCQAIGGPVQVLGTHRVTPERGQRCQARLGGH